MKKFIWRKLFFSSNPLKPYFISIFWAREYPFSIDQSLNGFEIIWISLNWFWKQLNAVRPGRPALCCGAHTSAPTSSVLSGHPRPPVAGVPGSLPTGYRRWTLRRTPPPPPVTWCHAAQALHPSSMVPPSRTPCSSSCAGVEHHHLCALVSPPSPCSPRCPSVPTTSHRPSTPSVPSVVPFSVELPCSLPSWWRFHPKLYSSRALPSSGTRRPSRCRASLSCLRRPCRTGDAPPFLSWRSTVPDARPWRRDCPAKKKEATVFRFCTCQSSKLKINSQEIISPKNMK
jgi:hypothetical protein